MFLLVRQLLFGFFQYFFFDFFGEKKPFPNSYFERNSQMILGKVVNFDLG